MIDYFQKLLYLPATPSQGTVVPDDLVVRYPDPPEKLQAILQRIPDTGIVLYQYKREIGMSNAWRYWAMDMMENGFDTPGIVQLAGEDMDISFSQFSQLLETIFKELGLDIPDETAYRAYAICIADEVLRGERTARDGFELLAQADCYSNYSRAFEFFYVFLDYADEIIAGYINGGGVRKDNMDEWMHQYFEKCVQANKKYCLIQTV